MALARKGENCIYGTIEKLCMAMQFVLINTYFNLILYFNLKSVIY